ncbi:MAG: DUF2848 domain-containing protein [Pseudomonadota bacterium]
MEFETSAGPREIEITHAVVAGWTARDRAAVDHHIEELASLGVAPPSKVPLYYRVAQGLLTQDSAIEVVGADSSGEIEPLVVRAEGTLWLGLASDHTDRALEATSVALSKQVCAKPICGALWRFEEVAGHLDRLELSCEIEEAGGWVVYQAGTLAAIRPLDELIAGAPLQEGGAMLCGTLAAIGGVRPATAYRMQLGDPVLGRALTFEYRVTALPVVA